MSERKQMQQVSVTMIKNMSNGNRPSHYSVETCPCIHLDQIPAELPRDKPPHASDNLWLTGRCDARPMRSLSFCKSSTLLSQLRLSGFGSGWRTTHRKRSWVLDAMSVRDRMSLPRHRHQCEGANDNGKPSPFPVKPVILKFFTNSVYLPCLIVQTRYSALVLTVQPIVCVPNSLLAASYDGNHPGQMH